MFSVLYEKFSKKTCLFGKIRIFVGENWIEISILSIEWNKKL
jgi:hypothetical protein